MSLVVHAPSLADALISFPDLAFALLFLAFMLWSGLRLAPTYSAYVAVIVLPPLFGMTTYSPYLPLASISRYVLLAFPAFILLGRWRGPTRIQQFLLASSFLVETFWLVLFAAWMLVG